MESFAQEVVINAPSERVRSLLDMQQQARLLGSSPMVKDVRVSPRSRGGEEGTIELELAGDVLQAVYRLDARTPHVVRYHVRGDWQECGQLTLEGLPDGRTRLGCRGVLDGVRLGIGDALAQAHLQRLKQLAEHHAGPAPVAVSQAA